MKQSLDKILGEFNSVEPIKRSTITDGGPVSIWLPPEYKARYDSIQERTQRRFGKKLREIIQTAIDQVDQAS